MKKNLKVALTILGVIVGLLIITNPSKRDMVNHVSEPYSEYVKRDMNLFIFSLYSVGNAKYFAICGNFFKTEGDLPSLYRNQLYRAP